MELLTIIGLFALVCYGSWNFRRNVEKVRKIAEDERVQTFAAKAAKNPHVKGALARLIKGIFS